MIDVAEVFIIPPGTTNPSAVTMWRIKKFVNSMAVFNFLPPTASIASGIEPAVAAEMTCFSVVISSELVSCDPTICLSEWDCFVFLSFCSSKASLVQDDMEYSV